jgi:hypothetical protein
VYHATVQSDENQPSVDRCAGDHALFRRSGEVAEAARTAASTAIT